MNRIFGTKSFDKQLWKQLSTEEHREFRIFRRKLQTTLLLGKPLGTSFFREKRINNKRIFFLIYEQGALFVGISSKKSQQETIDKIKRRLSEYKEEFNQYIR